MAFQGEYFVERYGAKAARAHAARSAACSRWASPSAPAPTPRASRATTRGSCLYWLVTRQDGRRRLALPRGEPARAARRRCGSTRAGSAWFSSEEDAKGALAPGQLADLAVLSDGLLLGARGGDPGASSRCSRSSAGRSSTRRSAFGALAPPASAREPELVAGRHLRRRLGALASHSHAHAHSARPPHLHSHPFARHSLWDAGCDCFVF